MLMARAGQSAAARRTASCSSGGGAASSTSAMPSSSRWSNTAPAASTHWPEATHLSWSTITRIAVCLSEGDGELVHPVNVGVVLERDLLERHRQAQAGEASVERPVDDLQLH